MFIKNIEFKNFRNYKDLKIDFLSNKVLIIGKNAQGKTNILEAIRYFSTLASQRASSENEMILWQKENASIYLNFLKNNLEIELKIDFFKEKKKILKLNGIKKTKNSDFLSNFLSVNFSVEDLLLLRGTPEDRRKWLDSAINQLYPAYYDRLSKYNKIRIQKGNLLKDLRNSQSNDYTLLEVFNEQLSIVGSNIIFLRLKFLKEISELAKIKHKEISQGENLDLTYNSNFLGDIKNIIEIEEIAQKFKQALKERMQEEIIRNTCHVVPNRDDVSYFINEIYSKKYASQGQQRTIVLALKLAELDLLTKKYGNIPVLLLDDVLAELDNLRQNYLLTSINTETQVIITSVDTLHFDKKFLKDVQIIQIKNNSLVF